MTTKELVREVEEWIGEHESVEQEELLDEFGRRGLAAVRELMADDRVSTTLYWDDQTESLRRDYSRNQT